MASKRRLRRKACQGKVRYTCAADAQWAMRGLHFGKGWQGYMQVYLCPFCKGYHYGHPPRRRMGRPGF